MDPQQRSVAEEFDAYHESYQQAVNDALNYTGLEHDFFVRIKVEHLMAALADTFGEVSGLKVLDLGCGIGVYHQWLSGRVGSLYGVDVSQTCVTVAARRYPTSAFTVYDGDILPFADSSFDAAFTICVMHHVPPDRWRKFASEMVRVVRAGGLVLVFEHNPRNPLTRYVVRSCAFDRDAVLVSPGKLRHIFQEVKSVSNISLHHILTVPPKGRLLQLIDRTLAPLGLGAQYYMAAEVTSYPYQS
jgi:ubiquinone/menaquinone biosynthesis C-methylase UbiE